jgi:hypothetical protein
MYGFASKLKAHIKAHELRQRDTNNHYEIAVYKYPETNLWGRGDKTVLYGVKRYIPYVPTMPWKFDGFVWFTEDACTTH